MAEGKLLVLGTILKLDRDFRPPQIADMTGLDRQLIAYHLRTFTDKGYLVKNNKTYTIRDKEALLNSLLESAEKTETAKMKPVGLFSQQSVDVLNFTAELIVAGRTFDLPLSMEARVGFIEEIDDSIKELKNLRKYLVNSTKTPGSARKFFLHDDERVPMTWKIYTKHGATGMDEPEFLTVLEERLKKEDD